MTAFLKACIKANQEISEYIHIHLSSCDFSYSNTIGEGGDNSLNIDLICEKIFIKHLLCFGDIYTEERGFIQSEIKNNNKIIIDPLDGSNNFYCQLPYYGTSVALEVNSKVQSSMVCNLANNRIIYKHKQEKPIELELFSLKKHETFIHKSPTLAIFEKAYDYPNIIEKIKEEKIKFRTPGAVAISLAYAKNYSFVLFAGRLRDFDIKAALHICEGLNVYKNDRFLIVSKNIELFNKVKEFIKE